MKILVACEWSGRVRDAFLKRGHDVTSCDILPTESPGKHFMGDVMDIIDDGWDMMIAHPPCTYLTCSAEWAYRDMQKKNIRPGVLIGTLRKKARDAAADFFMRLINADIPKIAIENPVGIMSTRYRKPDQFIQPHEYGHDASKKTGLWLKGLPLLRPTNYIQPRYVCCGEIVSDLHGCLNCLGDKTPLSRWANQTNSGQNKEPPHPSRSAIRGKTYKGWADAMGAQW